ncbi:MAG: hypothetical protein KF814_15160 [Nitrospiraceae bacterium]|nr:hypothetical protein [Nitrospiraceae bacterium]
MGITVLPPDVNDSRWAFRGWARSMRVGLMQIKGLRAETADALIADRESRGHYRSLQEFLERVRPDPAQARLLITAGCFDSIAGELTRPALCWRLLAWQEKASLRYLPVPPEYALPQLIAQEVERFGFPLRCHPLELIPAATLPPRRIAAASMSRYVGRSVTMVGVLITEKIVTPNGATQWSS